jgi:hypothetical protein
MSKTFTDEERDEIQRETQATLDRTAELAAVRKMIDDEGRILRGKSHAVEMPVETRNQRDRHDLVEQDKQFARERRQRKRETESEIVRRLQATADQRIAELESDLVSLAHATSATADALEAELRNVTAENAALKLKQAELEIALAELRLALAERGKVVDLPNPLRAVN